MIGRHKAQSGIQLVTLIGEIQIAGYFQYGEDHHECTHSEEETVVRCRCISDSYGFDGSSCISRDPAASKPAG
jgi:hypothetical protein